MSRRSGALTSRNPTKPLRLVTGNLYVLPILKYQVSSKSVQREPSFYTRAERETDRRGEANGCFFAILRKRLKLDVHKRIQYMHTYNIYTGKFRNVVLEKDGEDQLDRSCEK
jgi:hypothetical protein